MDSDVEHYSLGIGLMSLSVLIFIPSPGLIIVFILLIVCSGLISGSEVAFFSLDKKIISELEEENTRSTQRIIALLNAPRRLLATILISNNFINISIVIISDLLLKTIINQDFLINVSDSVLRLTSLETAVDSISMANILNFLLAVVVTTFILLVFGEVLPKIYARMNAVKLAKSMAGPLILLGKIFSPISNFLIYLSNIFEKKIESKNLFQNLELKKDLDRAIEITASGSEDSQEEVNFLKRILKFNDVRVKQIMKSRVDAIAIDEEADFTEVLNVIRSSGYSRLPVYKEDFDNVVGLLYAKNLIPYVDNHDLDNWQSLIKKEVFYVPDSKKINDLLKQFQIRRMHLAIVVDEYGGNTGIVTLEDVMEEVIGEIKDEFDDDSEQEYHRVDEDTFLFEGKTLINDFTKIMEVDESQFDKLRGESDSIAGLILETLGTFPKKNQELKLGELLFVVLSVNSRRIKQVKVTKNLVSPE